MKLPFRPHVPVLILCILSAALGFFLRMNQLRLETGASGDLLWGGTYGIALLAVCAVFAVALICLLLPLNKHPRDAAVFSRKPLPNVLLLLAAAALAAGSILSWSEAAPTGAAAMTVLAKLLPIFGLAAAGCLVGVAVHSLGGKTPSGLLYMCVSIYFAVRLILRFQGWNSDPAIQDYCYALLAIICTMLAAYQLGGFSFGKGKRRMTLFWALCAVIFCAVDLADGIYFMDTAELLIGGAAAVMMAVNAVCVLFASEPLPEN